jgi:TnpA family transposase
MESNSLSYVFAPIRWASYPYTYFGFGKGVSANSFIDEKSRLFYNTAISASEREAGYLIDGTMYNDEIESSIHSKDTLGHGDIVFGLCNTPGIFLPPELKTTKTNL